MQVCLLVVNKRNVSRGCYFVICLTPCILRNKQINSVISVLVYFNFKDMLCNIYVTNRFLQASYQYNLSLSKWEKNYP